MANQQIILGFGDVLPWSTDLAAKENPVWAGSGEVDFVCASPACRDVVVAGATLDPDLNRAQPYLVTCSKCGTKSRTPSDWVFE